MANIDINELNAIGSDLFDDAETYLQDLSEGELRIQGGLDADCWPTKPTTVTSITQSTAIICSIGFPTTKPYSPLCAVTMG
ncbi:hypothetical protein [Pseudanabaena sp. PCC 6802]|uniref:hypothetical protein n=1 Tax=Pseudanabaena sp. PCC 6802 TaxID=118173 RepID=UPI0003482719|nr:hypothetical protein [Pseudanabaena sp. PCC 6802]